MTISKKIKKCFVTEDRIFLNGSVLQLDDDAVEKTNCYDYALSIVYHDNNGFNSPGFTTRQIFTSNKDISLKVCEDLENLGCHYRKISPLGSTSLEENEYLIKLFYCSPSERFPNGTFHFIRQNKDTGIWYDKPGINQPRFIGDEPDVILFTDSITRVSFNFYPICYFAIQNI